MAVDAREMQDGLLTLRVSRDETASRISLDGELDLSNFETLESVLREAVDEGRGQIIVDMRDLSFIDSSGIACLVQFLREGGGTSRLRFVPSTSHEVKRVLQLTGIEERLFGPDAT